jgi:hypothetical protein
VRGRKLLEDLHGRLDPTIPEPFEDPWEYDRVRRAIVEAVLAFDDASAGCAPRS